MVDDLGFFVFCYLVVVVEMTNRSCETWMQSCVYMHLFVHVCVLLFPANVFSEPVLFTS